MKKGLNIEVTSGQYEFLYDLVMMAYELDVPEQKGWDMQTFDNLVDNVCNAKGTYLSNTVREFKQCMITKSFYEDLVSQLKEAGFEINQNALDVCNIRATQIACLNTER